MRLAAELGLEVGLVGAAGAAPARIAALSHETRDHAVERHAVVEAAFRKLGDALDMARREVRAQLDDDIAAARKGESQRLRVGHVSLRGNS